MAASIVQVNLHRFDKSGWVAAPDHLTIEEPMEIRLQFQSAAGPQTRSIAVTMRTPGHDEWLAAGFLRTEGIVTDATQIATIATNGANVTTVVLRPEFQPRMPDTTRNFYMTSSCGVCGKASIEAVEAVCKMDEPYPLDHFMVSSALLTQLPELLRARQSIFEQTGGIHACALFSADGNLHTVHEDVGRHNALDKLVGEAFLKRALPLSNSILLLSGRASFELIQKAAVAGVRFVAAVGAPSSLAVTMAEDWNITLVGFLRADRFNVYAGEQRIVN